MQYASGNPFFSICGFLKYIQFFLLVKISQQEYNYKCVFYCKKNFVVLECIDLLVPENVQNGGKHENI